MSSSSIEVAGNVAERGLDDRVDVPMSETLAKEPEDGGSGGNEGLQANGLEREGDSVGMEVDFAGESDSRAILMNSEPVVDEEGASTLEGQRVSINVEGSNDGVDDSREVLGESKGVVDDGDMEGDSKACGVLEKTVGETENESDMKGSMEAPQLVPESLNDGGFGGEVKAEGNNELLPYAEKTVGGKVVGVSYSVRGNEAVGNEPNAPTSIEEIDEVPVEEGVSEIKGVDVVVRLDESAGKDGENSKKKGKFCSSDLVWGKVRSHPWWPGQIFEPGDASDKARKHFRPKSYLVAYFGDHTFAWNDKAKLKPFVPHFSQMVKQTNMEAFRHAVGCALDEVSRRVEFGLSCRCINDDVYSELKTQVIENVGVQEQEIVHEHADRIFAASSFAPVKLLDYISSLALEPLAEVDKLEHVMARGRISAFYRWKGYYHLPKFGHLIGYVNNEADAPITEQKDKNCKGIEHQKVAEVTLEEHGNRPQKRKNVSGNDCRPTKKEKCLADMIPKRGLYKEEGDEKTKGKADRNSVTSSHSNRKVSKLLHSGFKTESSLQSEGATPMASKNLKPSFSVGESILRVAGQLSKPSPLLKLDVLSRGKTSKAKGGRKQTPRRTKVGPVQLSSDEILSDLQLAAREPLKDHGMLTSMVDFFTDFRNSVVQEDDISRKHEESGGTDIIGESEEGAIESKPAGMDRRCSPVGKSKEKAPDSEITTTSEFGAVEDACYTKVISTSELHGFSVDEKLQVECSPTALTLKFTDIDSIPSEAKLNKIFSHFGPLKESETQILTKKICARVVFKRRLDAETAFSSSGKFETFGPSLVCYRLNDAPSPCKSSSGEAKRRRKEQSPEEGNAV